MVHMRERERERRRIVQSDISLWAVVYRRTQEALRGDVQLQSLEIRFVPPHPKPPGSSSNYHFLSNL